MKPDWEAFGKSIMKCWPDNGLDGFELQEEAKNHGVILQTKYDPDEHGQCDYGSEKGDDYFVRNY